jgi:type II secretory pathway pseudopilin PulG
VKVKILLGLFVGFLAGFMLALAMQNLLDAKKRSWSKRTAADCLTISQALEAYRVDNRRYPPLDGDIAHLAGQLTPKYMRNLPIRDMSGEPFLVVLNGSQVAVVSVGQYGAAVEAGKVIRGGPWLQNYSAPNFLMQLSRGR